MAPPARDHHFVPQFYLRRWAGIEAKLMAYRTLVSHVEVPEWVSLSIKGIAFHRDLYAIPNSPELDEFERWIATEFEEPARGTLDRVVNGHRLTADDHEQLGSFYAAQDVRTPASFFESQERWTTLIPAVFKQVVDDAAARLESARAASTPIQLASADPNPYEDAFRFDVTPEADGQSVISMRAVSNRALWIAQMRELLTGAAVATLRRHRWSIVEPHGTAEWFTSDHPTLRLNFNSSEHYDFGGGWGRTNSDLFLPLSPRHLLFAQVGTVRPERIRFEPPHTRLLQRLLAERAHRWIFAQAPVATVGQDRPRIVDAERLRAEERFWTDWDDVNRKMEAD